MNKKQFPEQLAFIFDFCFSTYLILICMFDWFNGGNLIELGSIPHISSCFSLWLERTCDGLIIRYVLECCPSPFFEPGMTLKAINIPNDEIYIWKWDGFNVDIYHLVYYIDTCWYLYIFIIIWDITLIHNHSTENPHWYPRWFNVHRFLTWNPKALWKYMAVPCP